MLTITGRNIDVLALRPEDFNIMDVCVNLSHIGRFGGATRYFYSVGQHSCLISDVSFNCFCEFGSPDIRKEHRKKRFAHDFGEAYLGDIPRPIKYLPEMQWFREAEDRMLNEVIFPVLGLSPGMPGCVKKADDAMLVAEGLELKFHDYSKQLGPAAHVTIESMTEEEVQGRFMQIYKELFLSC